MPEQERDLPPEVTREPEQISVEELQRRRRELEIKVAASQKQKEQDKKQKLTDRETLVGEVTRLNELLDEGQKTLDYYESLDASGLLIDPKDIEGLEQMRQTVVGLREQRDRALQGANLLMAQPEVNVAVVGEAEKEDKERGLKRAIETAEKDLHKRVEDLITACEPLADRQVQLRDEQDKIYAKVNESVNAVKEFVDRARSSVHSKKYHAGGDLIPYNQDNETYEQYRTRLQNVRTGLGMIGSRDKKKALDLVLQEGSKQLFSRADQALEERNNWQTQQEQNETVIKNLGQRYKEIILDAWRKQQQIQEKYSPETRLDLPNNAYWHFRHRLEELGDVDRYDTVAGKSIKGKHKSLDDATKQDVRIQRLTGMVYRVRKEGGDNSVVYTRPEDLK